MAGYANPLAGAKVTPERIDQGVDFAGSGTISAIARAVVTAVSGGGWPGPGGFVEYQITDKSSPLFGQYVYQAEGVRPVSGLKVGDVVNPGTPVATIIPTSSTGLEIGFGSGVGSSTYAAGHGGYTEGKLTPAGDAFSQLLHALGGPSGLVEGRPLGSGSAPAGVAQAESQITGDLTQSDILKRLGISTSAQSLSQIEGNGKYQQFINQKASLAGLPEPFKPSTASAIIQDLLPIGGQFLFAVPGVAGEGVTGVSAGGIAGLASKGLNAAKDVNSLTADAALATFLADPTKVVLTIVFVIGGALMVFGGAGRMLGFDSPVKSAAAKLPGMPG